MAGSVAYTGQSAWILNRTLRDNVVLAGSYEEAAYRRVLECCALLPDLRTLPAGDMTEIGEKVGLAACTYCRPNPTTVD